MTGAPKIANRIAIRYAGKIASAGPTSDVDNSDNPHVDPFLHGRAKGPIKLAIGT